MAIGDIFKLAVVGAGPQGQQLVNTFHYRQQSTLILDTPGEDLVQAFQEHVEPFFLGPISLACELQQYQVRGITDITYGYDYILPAALPGGSSGQCSTPMVALIITWRTGLIGRSYRGRSYLWPVSETHIDAGQIDGSLMTDVTVLTQKLIQIPLTVGHSDWKLVLWSPTRNAHNDITQGVVRSYLGTQRRRRTGVGA